LIGLAHVIGFTAAAVLCFTIGAGLCAHGLVPPTKPEQKAPTELKRRFAFWRQPTVLRRSTEDAGAVLRCVCCRVPLAAPVHICPECGWTQPYAHR
jgi:hypothetical protein